MNPLHEKTLSHLTGIPDAADISVETLQELADQYPYFTPVQFFLASKLKQRSHGAASAQVVKTALYFNNPLWLQWQLYEEPVRRKTMVLPDDMIDTPTDHSGDAPEAIDRTDREPAVPDAAQLENEPAVASAVENRLSGMLTEQLADFKKPVSEEDRLEIEKEKERLHTIDYFASQGIRIDLSRIPQDKLTTQLRKFTDWLKEMKNPNPVQTDLGTSAEMENAVVEIAKTSNVSREVLTEAMAEVLAKQGQVEKAVQLLIKLSFINPEKSSYFAARIEQLKGIV
ncbi:MAG: hypothetical protein JO301_01355 [Chitinophagaceae bacterium]|nr:hypothetical protein [Chitinophagaceae bacterium]